jgi:hypothetical protein
VFRRRVEDSHAGPLAEFNALRAEILRRSRPEDATKREQAQATYRCADGFHFTDPMHDSGPETIRAEWSVGGPPSPDGLQRRRGRGLGGWAALVLAPLVVTASALVRRRASVRAIPARRWAGRGLAG